MDIVLSVVVPTKNRYYYLDFIVNYFRKIQSDRIELVIHDNSNHIDSLKFKDRLNCLADKRIKYFYVDDFLSQTENCDLAISHASGEWVTMIGDDDIFSKYLIDYCDLWNTLGYEAVLPKKASYIWPDVTPKLYKSSMSGTLNERVYSSGIDILDPSNLIDKISSIGGTEILDLPRIYHGVVKKDILEKIYQHCGSYSPGPSPDISNAVALCRYLTSFVILDLPLITSGQGIASAGGKGAQGQHYGELGNIEQLPKDTAILWNKNIPFYWSGKTIYAESVLKSLVAMNMNSAVEKFNYNYLYASLLVFDGNTVFRNRIFKAIDLNHHSSKLKIGFYFVSIWIRRIIFHLRNNISFVFDGRNANKSKISNFSDIGEVAAAIDKIIELNGKV